LQRAFHLCLLSKIIFFASGRGTNAAAIYAHLRSQISPEDVLLVCNKPGAGVLDWAAAENIPTLLTNRAAMAEPTFLQSLQAHSPDLIVLAGFLLKIPEAVVEAFPNRIINVHPALLPRHGGAGMWGGHVHAAVLAAGDRESGITVHRVNAHYDEGDILLQARCPVLPGDDAEALAARVLRLEHFYLPRVVEGLLQNPALHG